MNPVVPSQYRLSETHWRGIILALSITVLLFSVWCLTQGITTIFMHLYYFPIVLLAYRYRWKGFGLATFLALAYLGLVLVFDAGQTDVILGALFRFFVFVGIAAVIAYLSERLAFEKRSSQESAELQDSYLSLAPAIILVLDRNGAITYLNKKGGEILECLPDEAVGKSWTGWFLPEKERERVNRVFSQLMAGKVEPNRVIENPVLTSGGTEKSIRWNNTVLHDENGAITGILAFGEDITEEKWAREALREMQQFQESVITNANVWISVLEPDGTLLIWNNAAEAISGYPKTGVLGKNTVWKQLYPDKEYRKKVTGEIRRIIGRDTILENFETRIHCADGTQKTIVWNTRGLRNKAGAITSYIAIGRDVTAQKSAESRAGESSRFLAAMIDTLPIPVFFKDAEGKYLGSNPLFEECIGIRRDQLIGKTAYDIAPKDLADRYTAADRQILESPVPQSYETQVQYANGSRHDVIFYKAPFFNKDGSTGGLIGAYLDITERKLMEEALQESESFNRGLVENLPDYIAVYGQDGKLLYVNPSSARALGYDAETLVGTHVLTYIAEEYHDIVKAKMAARKESGEISSYEIDMVTHSGLRRSVIVKATPIQYQKKPAILLLLIDITERKKADDARALENQRMESLLKLSQMGETADSAIISEVVEDAIRLTGSTIGYLATMNDDESVMTMQYWSKSAHTSCNIVDKPIVYPIEKTGLWGEAVRQRIPVVTNDYSAGNPFKRGIPNGHVPLVRHMNIPVFDGDHIVAVAGVGNKGSDYNSGDVRQLQLLMQAWWQLVTHKRTETSLKASEQRFRAIFNNINDAVQIHEIEPDGRPGRYLDVNESACRMLLVSREELLSHNPLDFAIEFHNPPLDEVARQLHTTGAATFETGHRRTDGIIVPVEINAHVINLMGKTVVLSVIRDLTSRKKAEEAIRASEEQFRAIFQTQQTGLIMVDATTHIIVDANAAALSMIGASHEDVTGKVCHTFICPAEKSKCPVTDLGQAVDNSERVLIRANGETIPILKSVNAVKIGDRPFLIESFVDLTERKQMEKLISESRQLFADIISFLPDPTFVIDREGKVLAWNRAIEQLSGVSAGDIIGRGDHEYSLWMYGTRRPIFIDLILHPDQDFARVNYTGIQWDGPIVTGQNDILLPTGRKAVLSLVASPLFDAQGTIVGAIESIRDITRIKETEAELARLNQNLEGIIRERTRLLEDEVAQRIRAEKDVQDALSYTRSVVEANPDLMVVLDREGLVLSVNASAESLTGIAREQMIGTPYSHYLVEDSTSTITFATLLREGRIENYLSRIKRADGQVTPISINATVIGGTGVTDGRIIVSAHDITRQKQDEEAIRSSRQMLTNVVEHFPGVVFWKDKNSVYLGCNRNFSDGAGLKDPAEIIGKTDFDLPWAKTEAESYRSFDREVMEEGKSRLNIIETQLQSDGRIAWFDTSKIPLFGPDGTVIGILGTSYDITRQKHDEEAIQASLDEKVLLLREVHHRVKNNLQIIISLVNLQMRQTDDPMVKQIMSETQNRVRAMSLVHEKLYRSESLSRIDFADYTHFLTTQLFSFYGTDSQRVHLDFTLKKIMVDINTAVPLGLLMNELISNALKHAFPHGRKGTLSISGGTEGSLITLVVGDNGLGIAEDFDWKNTTSLGMRLVTSLIDQVDGTITLDRTDGTKFTVTVKRDPVFGGGE